MGQRFREFLAVVFVLIACLFLGEEDKIDADI